MRGKSLFDQRVGIIHGRDMRFFQKQWPVILAIMVFIVLGGLYINSQVELHNTERLFNYIDKDYSQLDQELSNVINRNPDYDQSTLCYYWKKPEFSFPQDNGPLGCF